MEVTVNTVTVETTYAVMAIAAAGAVALVVAINAIIPQKKSANRRIGQPQAGRHASPSSQNNDN